MQCAAVSSTSGRMNVAVQDDFPCCISTTAGRARVGLPLVTVTTLMVPSVHEIRESAVRVEKRPEIPFNAKLELDLSLMDGLLRGALA